MPYTVHELTRLGLDNESATTAVFRYGNTICSLIDILNQNPSLSRRIVPDLPFCEAEIPHCIKSEMAFTLEDVFRRRIPILILSKQTGKILDRFSRIITKHMNWSEQRLNQEITQIKEKYTYLEK
jgi:glycerol-3-phosphate dehydrogenase